MCSRIEIDEERLTLAFETLDSEHTGYLDASSIRRAVGTDFISVSNYAFNSSPNVVPHVV